MAGLTGLAPGVRLAGAITSTLGLAALVYGLTSAATGQNGVSHGGDTKVIVSLTVAVVLLATFIVIEARSEHSQYRTFCVRVTASARDVTVYDIYRS